MSERLDHGIGGGTEHPALLPWYADGNLDLESTQEVEAHLAQCPECRQELEALASMRLSLRGAHSAAEQPISLEDLLAYDSGDPALSSSERLGIERHLDACTTCAEDLAALRESGQADAPRTEARSGHRDSGRAWAGWQRKAWIAAAALVAFAGLYVIKVSWPTPAGAVTLLPAKRGAESTPVLRGSGPWSITIVLPFDAPAGAYRLLVESEDGAPVQGASSPISTGTDGRLSLRLASLPRPGRYRIVVLREGGAEVEPYRYPFRLEAATGSQP